MPLVRSSFNICSKSFLLFLLPCPFQLLISAIFTANILGLVLPRGSVRQRNRRIFYLSTILTIPLYYVAPQQTYFFLTFLSVVPVPTESKCICWVFPDWLLPPSYFYCNSYLLYGKYYISLSFIQISLPKSAGTKTFCTLTSTAYFLLPYLFIYYAHFLLSHQHFITKILNDALTSAIPFGSINLPAKAWRSPKVAEAVEKRREAFATAHCSEEDCQNYVNIS